MEAKPIRFDDNNNVDAAEGKQFLVIVRRAGRRHDLQKWIAQESSVWQSAAVSSFLSPIAVFLDEVL